MQEEAAEVTDVGQADAIADARSETAVAAAGNVSDTDGNTPQAAVVSVAAVDAGDAPAQATPVVDANTGAEQPDAPKKIVTDVAEAEVSAEATPGVVEETNEANVKEISADSAVRMSAEVVEANETAAEVVTTTASTPIVSEEVTADVAATSVEDEEIAAGAQGAAREEQPTADVQATAEQSNLRAPASPSSAPHPPPPAAPIAAPPSGSPQSGGISPRPAPRARVAAALEQTHEMAQSDLSPLCESEVLVEFRRGYDNSHVNRMMAGSYSRYLLSTDHLHEAVLVESFYGSLPTVGTAPLHSLRERAESEARSPQPFDDGRSVSNRSQRQTSTSYMTQPTSRQSTILTGTMSSTMRREAEMLNAETYRQLCVQREHRRHDPRHCQPQPKPRDFVYYNHKSKGYHIPYDPPDNALVLRYDDLYDFGDGTRFASRPPGPPRRNPTAPPPVTHGEWASRTVPPQQRKRDVTPQRRVSQQQRNAAQRTREAMQQGCSSLRTAKALDPQKLHCSQFRKTRTVEDVVTERSAYPIHGAHGMPVVMHADRQSRASTPSRSARYPAAVTTASNRGDVIPTAAMTFTDRTDKGVMGLLGGSIGYRTLA